MEGHFCYWQRCVALLLCVATDSVSRDDPTKTKWVGGESTADMFIPK